MNHAKWMQLDVILYFYCKYSPAFGLIVYLASAFPLVDDFESVLPPRGVLYTLPHDREVAVAQHAPHLVAL